MGQQMTQKYRETLSFYFIGVRKEDKLGIRLASGENEAHDCAISFYLFC